MNWIVLSYSLPSKSRSSPRVTLWRRLRRLGAVSPAGSLYVLPNRDECIEGFQWLAQEIRQLKGQAVILHVDAFEGLTDPELITLFQDARIEDYTELGTQVNNLEREITVNMEAELESHLRETLARLQKRQTDLRRIDYFNCPTGVQVRARLDTVSKALYPDTVPVPEVKAVSLKTYQAKTWLTRPQPHVDRLACIWLIRTFIDRNAIIRYGTDPKSHEVTFDMDDAVFGHTGPLCSFETMIRAFNLNAPGLSTLAELVHEIDLHDERYIHPEAIGIDAILQGWLKMNLNDDELESRGMVLFQGIFESLAARD